MNTMKRFLCRLLVVILVLEPVCSELDRSTAAGADRQDLRDPDRSRDAATLERTLGAVRDAQQELSRDSFDLESVVQQVGREPEKLVKWVSDNTSLVPYLGCLRGANGVLMDRLGNSLDRSLLLAELLEKAGHDVRLARRRLSDRQARELLERWQIAPPARSFSNPPPSREEALRLVTEYGTKHELAVDTLRRRVANDWDEHETTAKTLTARVNDQTRRLAGVVRTNDSTPVKSDHEAAVEWLRDHWWVQIRNGTAWVDYDTARLDNPPGPADEPQQILARDSEPGTWPLEATLWHEIDVRVVVEQWKSGRTREQVVLSHTLRPADLLGERIALHHQPMDWPKNFAMDQEGRSDRILKAATDQKEWLPVLVVGNRYISDRGFSASGETWKRSGSPLAGSLEKGVQGLDPFKRLSGLGGGQRAESNAQCTGEWIEYAIRSPGRPEKTIRREILDLLGPAARASAKLDGVTFNESQYAQRALAVLGEIEILPMVCQWSHDFVEYLETTRVLENGKIVQELNRLEDWTTDPKAMPLLAKLKPPSHPLRSLALARWQGAGEGRFYLDQVNLLTFHRHLARSERGELAVVHAFDIVANEVAVHPAAGTDLFLARVEQGIRDTNAETLLLKRGQNVGDLWDTRAESGDEWLAVRDPNDAAWKQLPLPDDLRARIARDLDNGYVVVVPGSTGNAATRGWWRVDPQTGHTLGMGDRGWGQSNTEWTMEHVVIAAIVVLAVSYVLYEFGDRVNEWAQSVMNTALGRGVSGLSRP